MAIFLVFLAMWESPLKLRIISPRLFFDQQRFDVDKNNEPLFDSGMKLRTYLSENGIDAGDFAKRVSVTKEAVRLWCAGERWPRRSTMSRIAEVTDNAVTANDFVTEARVSGGLDHVTGDMTEPGDHQQIRGTQNDA